MVARGRDRQHQRANRRYIALPHDRAGPKRLGPRCEGSLGRRRCTEELVDGYEVDVAGVGELVDVEVGGIDETGGRHVVGLDGPGGDGVVVPADAMPIPGGGDVGGAAVLRAGEVAVAVQLVAVLPVAVVGVAEVVAVVFVVAVAVVVAGGVVGGVVGVVAALVLLDANGKEVFRYVGKSNADRLDYEKFSAKLKELTPSSPR